MTPLTWAFAIVAGAALLGVALLAARHRTLRRERGRLEELDAELRASVSAYRSLFDSVTELIYIQEPETGRFLDVNQAVVDRYGYTRDEIVGSTPALLAAPELVELDTTFEHFKAAAAGTPQRFEWWGRTRDGDVFPKEVVLVRGSYFGRAAIIAVARDISGRLEAAETIRLKDEQYRELFEADLVGNFVGRPDGSLEACNESFARIIGYHSTSEALTHGLLPVDNASASLVGLPDRLRDSGPIQGEEIELRGRDGERVRILLFARGVFEDGALVRFHGHCLDITEQKRLAERVRDAQKMEAVGLLAGGVAHDFNNALTTIQGHAELLLEELPDGDPSREGLDEIRETTERASRLTRKLLSFSRRRVLRPRVVDFAALIRDSHGLLERVLGEDVGLTVDVADDVGRVRVDPGEAEQILLNLLMNAREALTGGGQVRIRLLDCEVPGGTDPEADDRLEPGSYVMLQVQDDGIGMDESVRARAFEPFFTTKSHSHGSGLGLATVYGVARDARGDVWVESELGRGSTVTVCFPRVEDKTTVEPPPRAPSTASIEVLLAEDEGGVRRLARRVLEREKLTVHEAPDGQAALDLAVRHPGRFAMLVTDVVMPGMRGTELADRLRAEQPDLPVLFMSGYTESENLRPEALERGQRFLAKPFSPGELREAVRNLLGLPEEPGG